MYWTLYNLKSPLINPFSDLVIIQKPFRSSLKDQTVIQNCFAILHKHSDVDRKLFPDINKRFALQVNNFHIDSKEIAVRQAMHSSALLLVKWFTLSEKYSEQSVAKLAATSLNIAFSRHPELAQDMLDLLLQWNVLTKQFRSNIAKSVYDDFSISSSTKL